MSPGVTTTVHAGETSSALPAVLSLFLDGLTPPGCGAIPMMPPVGGPVAGRAADAGDVPPGCCGTLVGTPGSGIPPGPTTRVPGGGGAGGAPAGVTGTATAGAAST